MFSNLKSTRLPTLSKKPTIARLEEIIWDGMMAHVKTGGKLQDGDWGQYSSKRGNCRCALSSLICAKDIRAYNKQFKSENGYPYYQKIESCDLGEVGESLIRNRLKLTNSEINAITAGFDIGSGYPRTRDRAHYKYALLGSRLRHRAQQLSAWVGSEG